MFLLTFLIGISIEVTTFAALATQNHSMKYYRILSTLRKSKSKKNKIRGWYNAELSADNHTFLKILSNKKKKLIRKKINKKKKLKKKEENKRDNLFTNFEHDGKKSMIHVLPRDKENNVYLKNFGSTKAESEK